jgi:predicted CopG family antitoxin
MESKTKNFRCCYDLSKEKKVSINGEYRIQTLKEYYNEIIEKANSLKTASGDLINMYKTGNFSKTALQLFYSRFCKIQGTHISFCEANWIKQAAMGALMIANKYEGPAWAYDYCSFYPSILRNNKMYFPVEAGEQIKLTKQQFNSLEFFQYGIYKVKVIKSNTNSDKLFRFNIYNYYTHFDLNLAKTLNLTMQIKEKEEFNFLYYERTKLKSGKEIFGDFINYLFEFKKNGVSAAKDIINPLWGAISECNEKKIIFKPEEGFELKNNNDYTDFQILPNGKMQAFIVDMITFMNII